MSLRFKLLAATALAGAATAIMVSDAIAYDGKWYLGGGLGAQWIPGDSLAYTNSDPNVGWYGDLRAGIEPTDSWFRYELDFNYRENDMDNGTGTFDATSGDITGYSLLLDVIYDFKLDAPWHPYLGVGGGWGHVTGKASGPNIHFDDSGDELAGQFIAGAEWQVDDNMLINLEYRYFDMEGADITGTIFTVPVTVNESFAGNAIVAGLRWTFGGYVAPPPPPPAPPPPPPTVFKIYFPWNKYALTQEAKQTVDEIASQYKSQQISRILIAGNTDTSGSAGYNMGLGGKRAAAVKEELIAQGIPESVINTESLGETNPAVQTGDSVKEPLNRRAEVTIMLMESPNT